LGADHDRIRVIELYIELGKRARATSRQLGQRRAATPPQ